MIVWMLVESISILNVSNVEIELDANCVGYVGFLFCFLFIICCSNFNKFSLFGILLFFSPFCVTALGNDQSISEQIICTRLVPMNNLPATENTAEDFDDSATEECLLFDVVYVHGIISLFITPEKEL